MNTSIVPSTSYRWTTPDGVTTIFVTHTEPPEVQIFIGKAGSTVSAWAYALAQMTTYALRHSTLDEVILLLSNISSDRATFIKSGVECRSTAEALSFALSEFKRAKRSE